MPGLYREYTEEWLGRQRQEQLGSTSEEESMSESESESESDNASDFEYYPDDSSSESDDISDRASKPATPDVDEPWDYTFKRHDTVWVFIQGRWYIGNVMSTFHSKVRPKVKIYTVVFRKNVKANFAPIDGTIKPDTPHIVKLLRDRNAI